VGRPLGLDTGFARGIWCRVGINGGAADGGGWVIFQAKSSLLWWKVET